jgi:hypothetical protein
MRLSTPYCCLAFASLGRANHPHPFHIHHTLVLVTLRGGTFRGLERALRPFRRVIEQKSAWSCEPLDVGFLKFLSSRSYSQPVFAVGRVLYSLPLAGKPEEYRTYITSVSPRNPQHPVTPPLFISLTSPLATIVIRNGTGRVQSVQEPYESTPGPPRYQVPSPHYRKGKRREDDHPAASV